MRAGGACYYDYQYFRRPKADFGAVDAKALPPLPEWAVDYFSCVKVVDVRPSAQRAMCLRAAQDLPSVEELYLTACSEMSKSELGYLGRLKKLRFVELDLGVGLDPKLDAATIHAVVGVLPASCNMIEWAVPGHYRAPVRAHTDARGGGPGRGNED